MIKNISKYITIFFCTVLINSANIKTSYADDHTTQRKLINKLKIIAGRILDNEN